jgi:hypothetical protein
MLQIFRDILDVVTAVLPILIALNGFFAVWAKLPKVGGVWATSLSKLMAVLSGDLGGLIRILERFWRSLQSQEAKQVAAPPTATITLANADDVSNFQIGQKVEIVSKDVREVIGILPILLLTSLSGCAAMVPTPSMPCKGMYCLEWDGSSIGLPADALACVKTAAELDLLAKRLKERHPSTTVRKLGAK